MRRFVPALTGLLISVLLFALVGCGNEGSGKESQSEVESGTQSVAGTEKDTGTEDGSMTESELESETGTETDTTSETESSTENNTPETESEKPASYTFISLDKTMWASDVLNVRGEPHAEGERIGQLAYAQEVKVTGQCNETSWYRIDYNGKTGYVSNAFLSEEKPVSPEPTPTPGPDAGPNPTVDTLQDVAGKKVNKVGSIYVIGNAAFEAFGYNDDRGATYAELITKAAEGLSGISNVYCMPIPLGSGVMLPDEYRDKVSVGDQAAAIDSVLGHMGDNVITVDIYDTLKAHSNEYLYFRTDHHWTQLGAYYAYTDFCKAKGIAAFGLDFYKHVAYDGFIGSFYFKNSEDNKDVVWPLYESPDVVYTYHPVSKATMKYTTVHNNTYDWPIIKDVTSYKAGVKYSCFIAGDNPYTIIENSEITDGSSCIVVKESYGNAFVPFLVDHYQTIHVIDQRYWDGNLIEFAKENNVTDVIFANNLTAIGSKSQLANFKGIIE